MIKTFHRVAEFYGKPFDIVECADYSYAVTHLQAQVGRCQQIHTGAVNTRRIQVIAIV